MKNYWQKQAKEIKGIDAETRTTISIMAVIWFAVHIAMAVAVTGCGRDESIEVITASGQPAKSPQAATISTEQACVEVDQDTPEEKLAELLAANYCYVVRIAD